MVKTILMDTIPLEVIYENYVFIKLGLRVGPIQCKL